MKMKKSFNIFLAFVIVFFTVPFGGLKVSADAGDNSRVVPDKAYEIEYVIKEDGKDKNSVANQYFVKPGILLVKDNDKYAQLTISNGDMVRELSTKNGDVIIVQENEDNSVIVQFKVESSEMDLKMRVIVPPGLIPGFPGYDEDYTTQLNIDEGAQKEIEIGNHKLVPSEGGNGPTFEPEEPETPTDPDNDGSTGTGDNKEPGDNGSDEDSNGDETENPDGDNEKENGTDLIDEHGSYTMDVSYLQATEEKPSAMARYLGDTVFVTVEEGKTELTITVTDHETVTKLQVEGENSVTAKLDGENRYETFELESLKDTVNAYVEYQAPYGDGIHYGSADFRIVFDAESINKVGVEDQPGYDIEEVLLNLDEGYYTIDASYVNLTDGSQSAMARYLADNAFVSVKDGKVELTITVNSDETVTKLQVNGEDAVDKVVDGDNRYETFELNDLLSILNGYVEYQAPFGDGIHYGDATFKIDLDVDSVNTAEASEKPGAGIKNPVEKEIELNEPTPVKSGEVVTVKGSNDTQISMPKELPDDVSVTITKVKKDEVKNKGDLKVAGEIYEFDFENLDNYEGTFELVMGYDADKYDSEQVDIYYFDEEKGEWIAQNGKVENGKITVEVTHFSTYGVFAKEVEEDKNDTEGEKPVGAEEIDYTIMHENGKEESTANSFFKKPGLLFEKDGKKYVEVTITNGNMVKGLSTFDTDAVIVKENDDGSVVVQFQVNSDMSDTELKMRVVVPGVYDKEHNALFVINNGDSTDEPTNEEKKPKPKPSPKKPQVSTEKPDKAYEINYVIMNKNGVDTSVADQFFVKPGTLLVKDGKTYLQVTINNGEMVEKLSSQYGDAVIVKRNKDGSIVVQLRVNDDLSDTLLAMKINVPGLYNADHEAILVFDKKSKNEIPVGDHQLMLPEKPVFDNDDNGVVPIKGKDTGNPQTG